jgi:hypothetical protein
LRRELHRAQEKDRRLEQELSIDRPAAGDAGDVWLSLKDPKTPSPSSEVGLKEEVERLERELSKLEWRLLILKGVEGHSWTAIADILYSEFGERRGPDAWRMYSIRLINALRQNRGTSHGR